MNKKIVSRILIAVMIICLAGVIYYPVQYFFEKEGTETDMEALREMRRAALTTGAAPAATDGQGMEDEAGDGTKESAASGPVSTGAAVVNSDSNGNAADAEGSGQPHAAPTDAQPVISRTPEVTEAPEATQTPEAAQTPEATQTPEAAQAPGESAAPETAQTTAPACEPVPEITPVPTPAPTVFDRYYRKDGTLPYSAKEAVRFDPARILPQYQAIYEQNNDLVGWLHIPGTLIDYPVLQSEIPDFYLRRDFYGNPNDNGQLILDSSCDPWTPSYNLVISGHNMKSGMMFGRLTQYSSKEFWARHKLITFDTLMEEGTYVVFAAFYSADYDVDEKGFRYNADIQYRLDAEVWLEEVYANQEYSTGIDVKFGDEILTLTTCVYYRENGRFVVVARKLREGEVIK